MLKVFLLFYIAIASCSGWAQQKITYDYDESGNRVSRIQLQQIIRKQPDQEMVMPGGVSVGNPDTTQNKGLDVVIDEERVNLYPNPTRGVLTVTVNTFSSGDTGELVVIDDQGRVVFKKQLDSVTSEVDLSDEPAGVYRINLRLGNQAGYYSVVKQ